MVLPTITTLRCQYEFALHWAGLVRQVAVWSYELAYGELVETLALSSFILPGAAAAAASR